MGGQTWTVEAPTIKELEKKAREWTRQAREGGLGDIRLGWDRSRVEKTEQGYRIELWAHT